MKEVNTGPMQIPTTVPLSTMYQKDTFLAMLIHVHARAFLRHTSGDTLV
jgi:hypothetical protein